MSALALSTRCARHAPHAARRPAARAVERRWEGPRAPLGRRHGAARAGALGALSTRPNHHYTALAVHALLDRRATIGVRATQYFRANAMILAACLVFLIDAPKRSAPSPSVNATGLALRVLAL